MFFIENKTWYFIWFFCKAEDSHETSSFIFLLKKKNIKNLELCWTGQYTPFGFLVWKETLHYFNLVSNKNLYYILGQIIRNGSSIQRGSILLKLKVGLWFFFPVKNVGGVTILLLCTFSDDALYFYHVFENISKGFKVIVRADTTSISKLKFSKGHNSLKNVGRVMVFNLCTSFDNALYLYQVS